MGGTKHDQNKPPLELIPSLSLEEVAKVLAYGRQKYAAWNWSKGFDWSRLIGAAYRHLGQFQRGEDLDSETQLSHVAHLACTSLFLLEHYLRDLGLDDRYKWEDTKDHGDDREVSRKQNQQLEPNDLKERGSPVTQPVVITGSCGCRAEVGVGTSRVELCSVHTSNDLDTPH